jgi:hypothetical protein
MRLERGSKGSDVPASDALDDAALRLFETLAREERARGDVPKVEADGEEGGEDGAAIAPVGLARVASRERKGEAFVRALEILLLHREAARLVALGDEVAEVKEPAPADGEEGGKGRRLERDDEKGALPRRVEREKEAEAEVRERDAARAARRERVGRGGARAALG